MELDFSAEETAFRDQVRTWLDEHRPRERRPHDGPAMRQFDLDWQRKKYEGGWAGIAWPREYGGCGLSPVQQMIWYEECARVGAPSVGMLSIALHHAGPTVMMRGTPEQKSSHLPRILSGNTVWCQGFSEPGAGSDLAGLRTRAVIDGDHLVVTGQKLWTSHAHLADFQETLVRTDSSGPKHKGITWVIIDMRSPGIEVRPIETLLPGYRHFCEVFYDEVHVPLSNVVGMLNEGWRIAMSTLSFERAGQAMGAALDLCKIVEDLFELARRTPGPDGRRSAMAHEAIAARLAMHRAEAAALRSMAYATVSRAQSDSAPGPESAVPFLYFGELLQRVRQTSLEILGVASMELSDADDWSSKYLTDRMHVIAGGTAEIRRNIISERLLGLPRSY